MLLSLSLRMETTEGPGVGRTLVPGMVDPGQPYSTCPAQIPGTEVLGGTYRACQPRATSTLAHPYLCTSALLPAPCSTSVSNRSRESTTTPRPGHPIQARQPRPRSLCPSSLSQRRLGQCFSFLPQSFHSILMWSYVLYHRLINPVLDPRCVLDCALVVAAVAGAQLSYA